MDLEDWCSIAEFGRSQKAWLQTFFLAAGCRTYRAKNPGALGGRLHWVLDTAFNEDQCRIRAGYAAKNIAIDLLRQDSTCKLGIKNKRLRMAYDTKYRESIFFGSTEPRAAT
jgi:hypothetical protein